MGRWRLWSVVAAAFAVWGLGAVAGPASGAPVPPRVAVGDWGQAQGALGYEFDPAVAFQPSELSYATCAKLLNYPDLPAPAGWTLQPEAAQALPSVSPDGLAYTFTVRPGIRFSPPSTEQVSADSFRVAIERVARLAQAPTVLPIAGIDAFRGGTATSISGISVSGNTLTIALTRPYGGLPAAMASNTFCAVPVSTPLALVGMPLPSAAPYYVDPASVVRDVSGRLTAFSLLRNPGYSGSRPALLPRLDYTVGDYSPSFAAAALAGAQASPPTFDWLPGAGAGLIQPADRAALAAGYGPGSAPDAAGHQQFFAGSLPGTQFVVLNDGRPGLADVRVRKAINYAADRKTMAAFHAAQPTDQTLAPSMPGFVDASIYPFSSSIALAQSLMQQAGYGPANHLALTLRVQNGNQARLAAVNDLSARLAQIWVDVTIIPMPFDALLGYVTANPNGYDMFTIAWIPDFADGAAVLGVLLDPRELARPGNFNFARFADPAYIPSFDYAYALPPGPARDTAWGNLDVNLMTNAAPWVPYADFATADFFSPRLGCQVQQPIYGISIGRLCERTVLAAGGTYSTGADATPAAPVQTSITTPVAGSVAVTTGALASSTSGYSLLGVEVSIAAPFATAASPLAIEFQLSPSLYPAGVTIADVAVLRNGVAVPPCAVPDGTATPDPCVASRTTLPNGNGLIRVLTSRASAWTFGIADTTPPTLESVALSANPVAPGTSVTLSVAASADAVAAEFFLDSDSGAGLNLPLPGGAGSFTSPPFGSTLPVGVHTLGVRVRDAALNWSPVRLVYLVVNDSALRSARGAGIFVPGGPSSDPGDALPGLDGSSRAAIAFAARYDGMAASAPGGELALAFPGRSGNHDGGGDSQGGAFVLRSDALEWLLAGALRAQLQGTGRIEGRPGVYRFRVDARAADAAVHAHVRVRVWPAAADPDAAPPLFQGSGDLVAGRIVTGG